jgi:hypothetical protein
MSIIVTKNEGGGGYDEGWKTVTISSAKRGDWNGSKFIDLWFETYPESLKCRIWEARSGDGEEFSVSNMVRYSNPDILEEMDNDGTTAAKLDDSPVGLKGKSLQVLFYKKDNGYSEISQKVAPAKPFENIVDNFSEERINRIKEAAEKYQSNRKTAMNGTSTTEDNSADEVPWD